MLDDANLPSYQFYNPTFILWLMCWARNLNNLVCVKKCIFEYSLQLEECIGLQQPMNVYMFLPMHVVLLLANIN